MRQCTCLCHNSEALNSVASQSALHAYHNSASFPAADAAVTGCQEAQVSQRLQLRRHKLRHLRFVHSNAHCATLEATSCSAPAFSATEATLGDSRLSCICTTRLDHGNDIRLLDHDTLLNYQC
jgi:hypothetical protein